MTEKLQHCFYCGKEVGVFKSWPGELVDCGARECAREAAAAYRQEREEAHDNLDRQMGWD
jgi:hypothetical protein